MKIKRYDVVEYDVLTHAHPDGMGYYPKSPHKERALLLMEEGMMVSSPYEKWFESGWKLTKKGTKYHDAFLSRLRKEHGHEWKMTEEGRIDVFALAYGYHNGPECAKCGYDFCQHCKSEFEAPVCAEKDKTLTNVTAK